MADMGEHWLTIMVGLPRSGKSTAAARLAAEEDAVVVSNDWIREHILGESYSYSEPANAVVWALSDAALRIVLGQGRSAVFDGANLTRSTRAFFVGIARRHGAKVRILWVNTPLKECLKRNSAAGGHKLPAGKLRSMADGMQPPGGDECDELVLERPELGDVT